MSKKKATEEKTDHTKEVLSDDPSFVDLLTQYRRDLSYILRIPKEEERLLYQELIRYRDAVEDGERDAVQKFASVKETLVEQYLGLVLERAFVYCRIFSDRGISILDLIQEGNVGLIHAVATYRPLEASLGTHAFWWINQRIRTYIYDNMYHFRLPSHVAVDINKIKRMYHVLEERFNRPVSVSDVAVALRMNIDYVIDLQKKISDPIYFSTLRSTSEGHLEIQHMIEDPHDVIQEAITSLDSHALSDALVTRFCLILNERERACVFLNYGFFQHKPCGPTEISHILGIPLKSVQNHLRSAALKFRRRETYLFLQGKFFEYIK